MAFESHTYTGICKYRDIDFTFVFDGDELRLIPPVDKKETIRMDWIMTPLAKGVYTMGDPLTMDEPYLTGHCNETGIDFIFITKQGGHMLATVSSVVFIVSCRSWYGLIALSPRLFTQERQLMILLAFLENICIA